VPAGFNNEISVSEAWLRHGLPGMIQGREHLRYGVSPMLVGPVFDVRSHGQSRISQNLGLATDSLHELRRSLLAEACIDEEDVITATVDVQGAERMSRHMPAPEELYALQGLAGGA
jgi:hypothetical protein